MADGPYGENAWDGDAYAALRVCVGKTPEYAGGNTMSLVITHLLDTGAVAERLWDGFLAPTLRRQLDAAAGGPGRGRTLLAWICALHDIGKVTPAFQCRFAAYEQSLRAAGLGWSKIVPKFPWHHGAAGGYLLGSLLRREGWPAEHIAWVVPLVAGHHGFVHAADVLEPPSKGLGQLQGGTRWDEARRAHVRYVTSELGLPSIAAAVPAAVPSRPLQLLVSGLVVMADWIASSKAHFTGIDDFARVNMAGARRRAAGAWERIGLRGGWGALPMPPADVFRRRFDHPPRPVQQAALDAARAMPAPGLLLVEAPTGEGKLWAGLAAAEVLAAKFGQDGVFVGMPQWSANDPTFARVREWVGRIDPQLAPQVALLHGQRNLSPVWSALLAAPVEERRAAVGTCDEDGPPEPRPGERLTPTEWFFGYGRGLLCPFAVGPTSTLLQAVTRTKFAALRMAGLLGKVVVLDEVHASDVHGSRFLAEGLRWFGEAGVPVVLLSATLPAAERQTLADAYLSGAARREEYGHPALAHPPRQPAVTAVWWTPTGPASATRTCGAHRGSVRVGVELLPEWGVGVGPGSGVGSGVGVVAACAAGAAGTADAPAPSPEHVTERAAADGTGMGTAVDSAVPVASAADAATAAGDADAIAEPPPDDAAARAAADAAVADRLAAELVDGGCALVIRTTADQAQTLSAQVRSRIPGTRVILLHEQLTARELATRMGECLRLLRPVGRRAQGAAGDGAEGVPGSPAEGEAGSVSGSPAEGEVGGEVAESPPRPHRLIVIASTVAEQSCDLDADLLITDLAPLDHLLQRIGRLHRGTATYRPARLRAPRVIVTGYAEGPGGSPAAGPLAVPPRFPAVAEERYGRHALLLAAHEVGRAATGARVWSYPADVPDLVATGYAAGAAAVPAAWRAEVAAARATADAQRRQRAADAGDRLLTRAGQRVSATLTGLHYLAERQDAGPEALDALTTDHVTVRAALLTEDGTGGYHTLSGTPLPAGTTPDTAQCEAVTADTTALPPTCFLDGPTELMVMRGWRYTPIEYTRVLILTAAGTATLGGRRLRYERGVGLVDEGVVGEESVR
ncbi:CRISPR-associated endonuclease Cas3'' [Streptomyces sp. 796.1]|uniref:CRISPR-associated endonuclease Cas3'' n=1 Tax=Streptomyces sp. 796.1 TaxID=3163029 RepID=UPI0039C90794